jgi:hypothetical protein
MRGLVGPPGASGGGSGRGQGGGGARRGAPGGVAGAAGGWAAGLGRGVRGGRIRNPARIVTPARAGGLLGLLAAGFLFTLATGPTAFGVREVELPELRWTARAAVETALGDLAGTNAFQVDTAPIEAAIEALPGVADADIAVRLPDASLVVAITERTPVLAWQIDETRFIADGTGAIFAEASAATPLPPGVAVVDDRRQGAIRFHEIGGYLDPTDLDVATRLGSLRPADVGSAAPNLRVAVTDADGFVVTTPQGWSAVFGFYSPATRSTDIIPGQVRLLRSLLSDAGEATVRRIILASETDGTYVPRTTPRPTPR